MQCRRVHASARHAYLFPCTSKLCSSCCIQTMHVEPFLCVTGVPVNLPVHQSANKCVILTLNKYILADARSLVFLAFSPLALVIADARSLASLANASLALVRANVTFTSHLLHARRFQIICLHQATREGRQGRLQLWPRSIYGGTKA